MNALKDPINQPATVYNNGRVALGKDLVFGWVVLAVPEGEDRTAWLPVEELHPHERRRVHELMDNNAIFPEDLRMVMAHPVFQSLAQHSGILPAPREGLPADFQQVLSGRGRRTMAQHIEEQLRQAGDDPNATIVVGEATSEPRTVEAGLLPPEGFKQ